MKKWLQILPAAVAFAAVLFFSGCKKSGQESAADNKVIKVGEYASLTGTGGVWPIFA